MIHLSTTRPDPNSTTFYNPDIQTAQIQTQEAKQRYSWVMQIFPGMASSYLPNHSILYAPAPHYAALTGSVEQLSQLASFFDLQTTRGLTPLHYAIVFRQKETIRFLLEKCNLSHLTPEGNTYLHYAALTGDADILALFQNRGIDPAIRNKDSLSAAHLWAFVSNDLSGLQQLAAGQESPEPFYFTPLQLMALNAAHANNTTLSESEWTLFLTNLADFGAVSLSWLCEQYRIRNYASSFFELAHTGLLIVKAPAIHSLAPEVLKRELNPEAIRKLHMHQWSPLPDNINIYRMPPMAMGLQSGVSAAAVAWNTAKEFPKLMQLSWTSALKTTGVRLTNLAFGLFDTYLAMNYPRYEGYYCFTDQMRSLPATREGLLETLSVDLAGQCVEDFPGLAKRNTPVDGHTKEIGKLYREAARLIHPDKDCPECDAAMINLNNLYEKIP